MSKNNNLVELLKNTSFMRWLKKEDGMDSARWEKWQQEKEAHAQLAADAKMLEKGISFKKQPPNEARTKASWGELSTKLNQSAPKLAAVPKATSKSTRRNWLKIAATITFLITACWGVYSSLNQATLIHYQTDFAKTKTIQLPDGTEVVLAANSSLSYFDDLKKKDKRTVQLIGEAYFKVAPQPAGKQFIVGLKDLSVTVIGTEFNVNSHRENSIVSLIEGKVALNKTGVAAQQLVAGETAIFNPTSATFELLSDQTNYWADWRINRWSFGYGMPMKEIIQRIEETFGLTVEVEDTAILARKASGSIAIDDQAVLFESLSYLLNIELHLNNNTLFISSKIENQE